MVNKKQPELEESLQQLEALVSSLESGELSLEASLKAFEQGVTLVRDCQAVLKDAEQRVQKLTMKDGEPVLTPFKEES